jgi:hypothetical protein
MTVPPVFCIAPPHGHRQWSAMFRRRLLALLLALAGPAMLSAQLGRPDIRARELEIDASTPGAAMCGWPPATC